MRLLLVSPTGQKDPFPIGLAYVSASLKRAGHEVDCCYFDAIDSLYARLQKQYDFVGTGGMSLHFKQIETIARVAKESHTRLIIGGNIISSEPELMTWVLKPDYAVIGEGDESIIELLKCLQESGDLSSVGGMAFLEEDKFVFTGERRPPKDLDSLPYPDYGSFEIKDRLDAAKPSDYHLYSIFDYPRNYHLVASRSCPHMCTFCYHTGPYRQRSIDSIMTELQKVIPEYRINIVEIVDDLFSYDQRRTLEFCTRFQEFRATLPWEVKWFCQMRVDRLDGQLLDAMKAAGLFAVSYGFESYSPIVLKSMKRHPETRKKMNVEKRVGEILHELEKDGIDPNRLAGQLAEFRKSFNGFRTGTGFRNRGERYQHAALILGDAGYEPVACNRKIHENVAHLLFYMEHAHKETGRRGAIKRAQIREERMDRQAVQGMERDSAGGKGAEKPKQHRMDLG